MNEMVKQIMYSVLLDHEIASKSKEFIYHYLQTEGGQTGNFQRITQKLIDQMMFKGKEMKQTEILIQGSSEAKEKSIEKGQQSILEKDATQEKTERIQKEVVKDEGKFQNSENT